MKFLITIFLLIHFNNLKAQDHYCVHDDFTIFGIDTINRTADGLKQGGWWEFELGANSISCFVSDTCYSKQYVDYVSAKGNYDLGKRTGEWFIFYPSGTLKRKVIYTVNGELDGALIDLYLNGKEKSLRIYNADTLISGMDFFRKWRNKIYGNV